MRKKIIQIIASCILSCVLCLSVNAQKSMETGNPKPFVIPELKEWKAGKGQTRISNNTRIIYPKRDAKIKQIASQLAQDIQQMWGIKVLISDGKPKAEDITLRLLKGSAKGHEGYRIDICDRINVTASHPQGLYWATRTILQIAEQNADHTLPQGQINDYPQYALRGFMLDCGRKFIPMRYLKDYVKLMAYYKMNTLQIHLNDNGFKVMFQNDWNKTYSAFRLECDTYPGLAARDGFYTKKEFIEFQEEAKRQGVEIIPEIDSPAHVLAFTQYKPELGSKTYGMDHFDLSNPETYRFMDALFKEYLQGKNPIFIGPRVHIGTDEYSNADSTVVEQFRAYTDHYIKHVESFGKQACTWGALTHAKGKTRVKADNVVMSLWYNGFAEPKEMIKQGYKVISIPDYLVYIVPQTGYYNDYLDTKLLYQTWTPAHIGKEIFAERHPSILGGMFAVWNDHVGNGITNQDIYHRVFPAMQTMSAKMWSGAETKTDYETFDASRQKLSEAPGVNRLGRIGQEKGLVYSLPEVKPDSTLPYKEIGYDYSVSFDIIPQAEAKGTVLFESEDATFYLSDPIRGMLGYACDGYLTTFSYSIPGDKQHNIMIRGDHQQTSLYIDDKLVETRNIEKIYLDDKGKDKIFKVHTLVFPLQKAGHFKSRVLNLKVNRL